MSKLERELRCYIAAQGLKIVGERNGGCHKILKVETAGGGVFTLPVLGHRQTDHRAVANWQAQLRRRAKESECRTEMKPSG